MNKIQIENIEFNPLKHHLKFISSFVAENEKTDDILKSLLQIGHSVTDIYTGKLPPLQIIKEIVEILQKLNITNIELYKKWIISNGKDYKTVSVSDSSKWTLRIGKDEIKFVHIHPCRKQTAVKRFNANTLKTAILFLSVARHSLQMEKGKINEIRNNYLGLPPIKSLGTSRKLTELIALIKNGIVNE